MDGDGPDETEQFAAERGHNLILVFPPRRERLVAFMETILRFPGDPFDLIAES